MSFYFTVLIEKGKNVKNKIGKFIVVQPCLGFLSIRVLFTVNTYFVYSDREKNKTSLYSLSLSFFFLLFIIFFKLKHEQRYVF